MPCIGCINLNSRYINSKSKIKNYEKIHLQNLLERNIETKNELKNNSFILPDHYIRYTEEQFNLFIEQITSSDTDLNEEVEIEDLNKEVEIEDLNENLFLNKFKTTHKNMSKLKNKSLRESCFSLSF